MKQPTITNTEQAREFYKKYVHDCPRGCDLYDAFTLETLKAYEENSSQELEHKWAFEEFEKYFSQIAPKNPQNPELLKNAWEWRNDDTPVKLVAEKLEIMMNECNGKPDKMLLDCLLVTAGYGEINKDDKSEEQTLVRLMEMCSPFVSEEEENERLRFKIIGPASEEETKREYRINGFSDKSNRFQTITAEQSFKRFATPENMLKWKQEYFDEWTDKEYFLDKESMYSVNLVELAALNYGVYSEENTRKLYDKLSDYKNCAAEDQYWHIAYEIVSHLSKRLFEDGEYHMLDLFYRLAFDMLNDAPDCWDKEYFGSHALDTIEEYRRLIEEKINGIGG